MEVGAGDVGEIDERTKMMLLSLFPALSGGGGEQGTTNGVLLNALGAINSGSGLARPILRKRALRVQHSVTS
jgi:hypothetical protein